MLSKSLSRKQMGLIASLLTPILVLALGFNLSQAFFNVTYNPPNPPCNDGLAYRWETTLQYCPNQSPWPGVIDSWENAYFSSWSPSAIRWRQFMEKTYAQQYAPGYNYCSRSTDKLLYTGWYDHYAGDESATRVWRADLNTYVTDVDSYTTIYQHKPLNGVNYICPTHHQNLEGYRRCDNEEPVYNPWISDNIIYDDGPNDLEGEGVDASGIKTGRLYPCQAYP